MISCGGEVSEILDGWRDCICAGLLHIFFFVVLF